MKTKIISIALMTVLSFLVSCESEEGIEIKNEFSDELAALVADEVISDIDFADLLDEGDDGSFWDETDAVSLKSASIEQVTCYTKTVEKDDTKKIITFEYTGDCARSGTLIIEIYKPDEDGVKKKTVTYIDFKKRNVTYNGTRHIERGNGRYYFVANMEIDRIRGNGDSVHIERDYEREVEWLCGLDTRDILEDNIKQVTGKSEVSKTINGTEEVSYSRIIVEPLLIVKACDLRIQAGVVELTKKDGRVLTINYGDMPEEIDCESDFECDNTFTVTVEGETANMEYVDGERVEVSGS